MKPLNADAQQKLRFGSVSKFWEKFAAEKTEKDPKDGLREFLKSLKRGKQ